MLNEAVSVTGLLSKVEILRMLTTADLQELAKDFKWKHLPEGTDVFQEGQMAPGFFILQDGKAEALIERKGAQPFIKKILGPGESFGHEELFSGKPSTVTVRCLTACNLLMLDADNFAYMLMKWPDIYRTFVGTLSEQLNQINMDLLNARYREFVRTGLKVNQMKYEFYGLWGTPKTTLEVERQISTLTHTNDHALLIGERGTGQQMMAWFVHKRKFGEASPFIFLEGGKLDQQGGNPFFEIMDFPGKFAAIEYFLDISEGGTLFIRDIDQMSPRMQNTLIDAINSRAYTGRIIATLNSERSTIKLVPGVKQAFAQQYILKPLRERKKDILHIALGVLEKIAEKKNRPAPELDNAAAKLLLAYKYRLGNISELIQVIERAYFLAQGGRVGVDHIFLGPTGESSGLSKDMLTFKWIKNLIAKGIFPGWVQRLIFVVYWLLIAALLLVPHSKAANYPLTLIWGLWWPFTAILAFWVGRIWCSVCPFSSTMEVVKKYIHLDRPVPKFLKKYDYYFSTFLFVLFPWLEEIIGMRLSAFNTGLWLLSVTASVTIMGMIFSRHSWCRHLCPLGGFIGMTSLNGMIEVRANAKICLNECDTHDCYVGTSKIEGCPMSQHTAFLDSNHPCKLCMRCVRTCHRNAVRVNLRVPAREVWHLVRVNQGFTIFIGTGLAVLIPMFIFEHFYEVWPLDKWRLLFSIAYWATAVVAVFVTKMLVKPFRTLTASKQVKMVFALIPMVVAGNVAYQVKFIPGAKNLLVGLAYRLNEALSPHFQYVPIYRLIQVAAVVLGVLFTGLSIVMVIRTRKSRVKVL